MAKQSKKHKLELLYDKAVVLSKDNEPSSVELQRRLGLSVRGADCLIYMLRNNTYCPELENTYTREDELDSAEEEEKIEIQFLEDMPPFNRGDLSLGRLSNIGKEQYVALGVAEYISPEEVRQYRINVEVHLVRYCNQVTVEFREALAHRDSRFFKNFYQSGPRWKVLKLFRSYGFTEAEIKMVLELVVEGDGE